MDSPSATPGSVPSSNDENPRLKFLCSFSGNILPRPQDGKLRYVGGETRIVSVPRDISYEELMGKMRELYEGAAVLKYQQPDEDLDALVSVVNDDDVTNMMEEYDKLGSGDGFTRLRIFLFAHPDQDGSSIFMDGDERDTERRYVDALNSLNESPEFRNQQLCESPVTVSVDDVHAAEQYFSQMNLEGGVHNQRNYDFPTPQFNLRHLRIPHTSSGQNQQPVSQRYNELDAPRSPAYHSPRHAWHHDPRTAVEFPTSPSSALYRSPYVEFPEKTLDRMPEEFGRQQVNHLSPYDHQLRISGNVSWLPSGTMAGDPAGFPGNILDGPNVSHGNNSCEHCRTTFQRNQAYLDSYWKHGEQPHLEQPNMPNGFHQVEGPCAECLLNGEPYMFSSEANYHHGLYSREQHDPRSLYSETHSHERGWIMQHLSNPRAEEPRSNVALAGMPNDHHVFDSNGMNTVIGHDNLSDVHHLSASYVHNEDPRYIRSGPELGNEVYHDQTVSAAASHVHIPPLEERGLRYGHVPYAYGADSFTRLSHGHAPEHLWRPSNGPLHGAPSYEAPNSAQQANGTVGPGFIRGTVESGHRLLVGMENQSPWLESHQKMAGFDGSSVSGHGYGQALKFIPLTCNQENQCQLAPGPLQSADVLNLASPAGTVQLSDSTSTVINNTYVPSTVPNLELKTEPLRMEEKGSGVEANEVNHVEKAEDSIHQNVPVLDQNENPHDVTFPEPNNLKFKKPADQCCSAVKQDEDGAFVSNKEKEIIDDRLIFVTDLIVSVKKAAMQCAEEVKRKAEKNDNCDNPHDVAAKEETGLTKCDTPLHMVTKVETRIQSNRMDAPADVEADSDNDKAGESKIEPTKAEEEAIARGLQTIRNDDLEEVRELGSGTYGAVYHGKWKGSDVAIKRIKASCFAGRPSERERLMADFWKEALILSSLHHPNVVSLYGIVCDGPDGSLATVTEFMVNGSLKQFLQKKDRTIDRRKRLIIAMDAAFGMEYLHGKNIVHFDLKCENLLVNMRDPHRPVCKIGDLGLSKVKQHTLVSGGVRGTLPWMAPELLSGNGNMVTEKIDVYSFGIVMWELLTGEEPYADMHCASIIGGIVNNTLRPKIPTWCDPEWKSLMESCWASDPSERPSFSEISRRLRSMAAAINVK